MENADEKIQVILLDFGGVVAEEGFRQGLMAIGAETNLGGQKFFEIAENLIYETGYIIGKQIEKSYWNSVRQVTGIRLTDMDMRMEILRRFKLRRGMLKMVETLRRKGYFLALLSDQTNWLDELDARKHFCGDFDAVFNSYHLGKSKRDVSIFLDVAEILGVSA
ncbi:MAG: HAD-IA family hydrolase, partial [Desulfomonilaceae bacterium]